VWSIIVNPLSIILFYLNYHYYYLHYPIFILINLNILWFFTLSPIPYFLIILINLYHSLFILITFDIYLSIISFDHAFFTFYSYCFLTLLFTYLDLLFLINTNIIAVTFIDHVIFIIILSPITIILFIFLKKFDPLPLNSLPY